MESSPSSTKPSSSTSQPLPPPPPESSSTTIPSSETTIPPSSENLDCNLDTSPLTPSLMETNQLAWFTLHLPSGKGWSTLSNLLAKNLTSDDPTLPASFPNILSSAKLHPSLRPHWKFVKFLVICFIGVYVSRQSAESIGSRWNDTLDLEEFIDFHFWPVCSERVKRASCEQHPVGATTRQI